MRLRVASLVLGLAIVVVAAPLSAQLRASRPVPIEEGLKAAASIGDDRLQRMAGRHVNPDAFTHGTSAQREQWFRTGFQQGTVDACDTFRQG